MLYVMDLHCVWSLLCAGVMRTELGIEVELCGVFWVSFCDVSLGVKRITAVDPILF